MLDMGDMGNVFVVIRLVMVFFTVMPAIIDHLGSAAT